MFAFEYGREDVVKLLHLESFENETFRVIFKHCGLLWRTLEILVKLDIRVVS